LPAALAAHQVFACCVVDGIFGAVGDWLQQKAVAERVLRVFVRHVDYDNLQLRDGVRIFVAEQFHPDAAPPAVVDPVLQVGA